MRPTETRPTTTALTETQTHPVLGAPAPPARTQRVCDLVLGTAFFAGAVPVIVALWAAVRLTSVGPGFYSQVRVGRNGRPYRIFKIRTMTHDCERKSGAQWATRHDPRVTALGRVLRKLHLDELPQLWNVLRGDMSLVGPRPERPEFVGPLSVAVPGYGDRHRVRPGVTGLAQIQLPADTDVASVRNKLVLDRYYAENRGPWLDARIMLGTAIYLLGFSYATVRRVMRLPNPLPDGNTEAPLPVGPPKPDGASCPGPVSKAAGPPRLDSVPCGNG